MYRVEEGYLNMKEKRLDSLKTGEVRLVLKPKVQGVFPTSNRSPMFKSNKDIFFYFWFELCSCFEFFQVDIAFF